MAATTRLSAPARTAVSRQRARADDTRRPAAAKPVETTAAPRVTAEPMISSSPSVAPGAGSAN
eukprot:669090-Prymnesium_polylepis.1